MKASDFNLEKEIKFSYKTGEVTFKNNRYLIFDANAFGLLRESIIEKLGLEETRKLFLKFGYIWGYSDYMLVKTSYEFDDEFELMKAGPVIHSWVGLSHPEILELNMDREKSEFYLKALWINSFESEQYLTSHEISLEPVCWLQVGYASGYTSGFFGKKVIAIEHLCVGRGDDHCELQIKTPEAWDDEIAKPYIEALKEF